MKNQKNLEGVRVGDRVWNAREEKHNLFGTVLELGHKNRAIDFFLIVEWDDGSKGGYTIDGYRSDSARRDGAFPLVYFDRPVFDFPKRPEPPIEEGELVWGWDDEVTWENTGMQRYYGWLSGVDKVNPKPFSLKNYGGGVSYFTYICRFDDWRPSPKAPDQQ